MLWLVKYLPMPKTAWIFIKWLYFIGEALKEKGASITHVYVSPALRCVQTATHIVKSKCLTPVSISTCSVCQSDTISTVFIVDVVTLKVDVVSVIVDVVTVIVDVVSVIVDVVSVIVDVVTVIVDLVTVIVDVVTVIVDLVTVIVDLVTLIVDVVTLKVDVVTVIVDVTVNNVCYRSTMIEDPQILK